MSAQPFEPKFMKIERSHRRAPRAHTAEDARRGSRSRHRGLAAVRARARLPTTSSSRPRCTPASPTCRPRRCSTRWPTRSICASRSTSSARQRVLAAMKATGVGALRHRATSTTCCTTIAICAKRSTTSCCACSTPRRCSGLKAVCGFVGRNQKLTMDQNLVDLRGGLHPAAQRGEGARPRVPRRAVPDARLDDGRQLPQQHRLRARARGSRCTASARSTASATISASTTIRRTRS